MKQKLIPQSPVKLQKEIYKLHIRRKNGKMPSKREIGWKNELSLAAGGSKRFIDSAIQWKPIMKNG